MNQTEQILQIITNVSQKIGFLKSQSYRLILTDQRIIFAIVTKEMHKAEDKALTESLKGKGFKERMGAVMSGNKRIYDKYQAMAIEQILNETPGNFSLPINKIKKVKRLMGVSYDENNQPRPKNITLVTEQGKHVLRFHYAHESDEAYRILKGYIK